MVLYEQCEPKNRLFNEMCNFSVDLSIYHAAENTGKQVIRAVMTMSRIAVFQMTKVIDVAHLYSWPAEIWFLLLSCEFEDQSISNWRFSHRRMTEVNNSYIFVQDVSDGAIRFRGGCDAKIQRWHKSGEKPCESYWSYRGLEHEKVTRHICRIGCQIHNGT